MRRSSNAALGMVPLALATIEVLTLQTKLRLLLFPSLASSLPAVYASHRAACDVARRHDGAARWARIGSVGAPMLTMRALRVTTAPVLAIAILPLVYGVRAGQEREDQ